MNKVTIWDLEGWTIHNDCALNGVLIDACDQFLQNPLSGIPNQLRALRVRDRAMGIFQEMYSFTDLQRHSSSAPKRQRTPYDALWAEPKPALSVFA